MDNGTEILDKDEIDLQEPKDYAVILLNDNYTPMDFVVSICVQVFHKTVEEAEALMLEVHTKGKGIAGTYTYDVALTKQMTAINTARAYGFPFKVEIEEC